MPRKDTNPFHLNDRFCLKKKNHNSRQQSKKSHHRHWLEVKASRGDNLKGKFLHHQLLPSRFTLLETRLLWAHYRCFSTATMAHGEHLFDTIFQRNRSRHLCCKELWGLNWFLFNTKPDKEIVPLEESWLFLKILYWPTFLWMWDNLDSKGKFFNSEFPQKEIITCIFIS